MPLLLLSWRILPFPLAFASLALASFLLRTNLDCKSLPSPPLLPLLFHSNATLPFGNASLSFTTSFVSSSSADTTLHPNQIVATQLVSLRMLHAESLSPQFNDSFFVEDVVTFPGYLMLFIKSHCKNCSLAKEEHNCVFGGNDRTPVISVAEKEPGLLIARCPHPKSKNISHAMSATLAMKVKDDKLLSRAEYPGNQTWDALVYELLSLKDSVLLCVKGSSFRRFKVQDLNQLACFYGPNVKTKVLAAAQEVVRCDRPPQAVEESLAGVKVSVSENRKGLMPSVARFKPEVTFNNKRKKHYLCACSMVWNQASFLKEWIMYHGWLGVERWFLYDNNSDDDIEEVVNNLSRYNVSRHIWPWIKTQEAGFSHCAMRAQSECSWVMFTDVDEFIYPKAYVKVRLEGSIMKTLIRNVSRSSGFNVGEIRIDCFSFGPSGLTEHPKEGVTVGYTCRMQAPERHKSIVKLEALNNNLLNVVHHFYLKPKFRHTDLSKNHVVINHYKYQVWDVFKRKFVRRVATYITDWTEKQNEGSRDRTPGLGTEAIEPADWKDRFCEVNDTGLKNLALENFQNPNSNQRLLQWQ